MKKRCPRSESRVTKTHLFFFYANCVLVTCKSQFLSSKIAFLLRKLERSPQPRVQLSIIPTLNTAENLMLLCVIGAENEENTTTTHTSKSEGKNNVCVCTILFFSWGCLNEHSFYLLQAQKYRSLIIEKMVCLHVIFLWVCRRSVIEVPFPYIKLDVQKYILKYIFLIY